MEEALVRAEQNGSDRKEERKRERERNSRDSSARVRREGVGRVTGKAAGSAGVCTTDTCLDSITGLESHSFLPIKTEKTDPRRPLASPPTSSSPTPLAVSVTASSHPMPPSTTLCSLPSLRSPPFLLLRSSLLPGPQDTSAKSENTFAHGFRMGRGRADAFYSFISSVIHLYPIRGLD